MHGAPIQGLLLRCVTFVLPRHGKITRMHQANLRTKESRMHQLNLYTIRSRTTQIILEKIFLYLNFSLFIQFYKIKIT